MGFGKTDLHGVSAEAQKLEHGDTRWFSVPEQGQTFLFLAPPWSEDGKTPYRKVRLHYGVIDKEKVVCLKEFGQECPLCNVNSELFALGKNNPVAKAISGEIYAKDYFLYNAIGSVQIQPQTQHNGTIFFQPMQPGELPSIKPWCMSSALHLIITGFFSMYGDIFDPYNGNMLVATKVKNSDKPGQSRINVNPHPMKSKLSDQLIQLLMTNLGDPGALLPKFPLERYKQVADSKMAQFRSGAVSVPSNYPQQQMPVPGNTMPMGGGYPFNPMTQGTVGGAMPTMPQMPAWTPPTQNPMPQQMPQAPQQPQMPSMPQMPTQQWTPPPQNSVGMPQVPMQNAIPTMPQMPPQQASIPAQPQAAPQAQIPMQNMQVPQQQMSTPLSSPIAGNAQQVQELENFLKTRAQQMPQAPQQPQPNK